MQAPGSDAGAPAVPWLSEPPSTSSMCCLPWAALPRGCEMTASGQETTCFLLAVWGKRGKHVSPMGWGKHFFPQLANEGPK